MWSKYFLKPGIVNVTELNHKLWLLIFIPISIFLFSSNDIITSLYVLLAVFTAIATAIIIVINPFWGLILIILYGHFATLFPIPIIESGSRVAGIIVALGWFLKYFMREKTLFFDLMAFNKILLIFVLSMILSSTLAAFPIISFKMVFKILFFIFLVFIIQDFIVDKKRLNIFIFAIALSVGIASFIGLIQYVFAISGYDMFGSVLYSKTGDVKRLGGFDSANAYALTLMSGIPFLTFIAIDHRKLWIKIIFFCCLISSILSLGLTVSRTHIIAFLIFGTIYIFLIIKHRIITKKHFIIFAMAGIIITIFMTSFLFEFLSQRSFKFDDSSSITRLDVFIRGIHLLAENPLFGIGFNNIGLIDYGYKSESLLGRGGHDLVSLVFTSTGLLGSLTILFLFYKTLKYLNASMKSYIFQNDKYLNHLIITLKSGYIALLCTWVGVAFIFYKIFWIYTALAVILFRWSALYQKKIGYK